MTTPTSPDPMNAPASGSGRPPTQVRFETDRVDHPRWALWTAQGRRFLCRALLVLAALWIFGGMLFFGIRFGAEFYRANQGAIQAFLNGLFH